MIRNWTLSAAAYASLVLVLAGLLALVRPLPRLGLQRRRAGWLLLAGAAGLVVLPLATPPPRRAARTATTQLDVPVPEWDFAERHETETAASPAAVDAAIRTVTAGEIRFFGLLTSIRAPRLKSGAPDILHAPAARPILEVATSGGFVLLADEPGRELVFGTLLGGPANPTTEEFLAHRAPGVSKAVMNFRIGPGGGSGCRLVTETRVTSMDASARRAFDYYWRLIFPGSAIIRREWLSAIKRRAEERSPYP